MVPSSAASALPVVAARTIAVMKGPISRVMLAATMVPIWSSWPNFASSIPVCSATIIPMKRPTSSTTQVLDPGLEELVEELRSRRGRWWRREAARPGRSGRRCSQGLAEAVDLPGHVEGARRRHQR